MLLAFDICDQNWDLTDPAYHPIDIPACDWYLDPDCSNDVEMPFYRVKYENITSNNNTKYVQGYIHTDRYSHSYIGTKTFTETIEHPQILHHPGSMLIGYMVIQSMIHWIEEHLKMGN